MPKNLTCLSEGETAQVCALHHPSAMKRRLQDLGLVEGTQVACVQKSPHGDPIAYHIRGAIIALRYEDAAMVAIRE